RGVFDASQELASLERRGPKRVMCLQQKRTITEPRRDFHESLANSLGIIQILSKDVEPQSPECGEQLARRPNAVAQTLCAPVHLLGRWGPETLACQQVRPERDVECDLTQGPLV